MDDGFATVQQPFVVFRSSQYEQEPCDVVTALEIRGMLTPWSLLGRAGSCGPC